MTYLGAEIFVQELETDVGERFLQETGRSKHDDFVQQRRKVTLNRQQHVVGLRVAECSVFSMILTRTVSTESCY